MASCGSFEEGKAEEVLCCLVPSHFFFFLQTLAQPITSPRLLILFKPHNCKRPGPYLTRLLDGTFLASKGRSGMTEMGTCECAKALRSLVLHEQHPGENKRQGALNHRADPNFSSEPPSLSLSLGKGQYLVQQLAFVRHIIHQGISGKNPVGFTCSPHPRGPPVSR